MHIFKSVAVFFVLKIGILSAQNSVSGNIIDTSGHPLAFANVVLYEASTNTLVKGAVSDDKGYYYIKGIPDSTYLLEVSVLGFKTIKSENFSLSTENRNVEMNFNLEEQAQSLNEVVVTSNRPVIRQTAEKLIVDLEQSEMVSSNLQDVMKKVPGIIVTNGNITYGGQQGVTILINGKTTEYMDISSLLRDLPADNIAKVELVQQPGAEFDAEGSGPLINIILKKNVRLGTNGNLKLYSGYDNRPEYGVSGSIASYKNKINWQVGAGYRKSAWREDLFITRRVNGEIYDQSTISPYNPKTYRFNGGLDYYINEHHAIGFGTRFIHTDSDRIASNSTQIIEASSSETLLTENSFDRNRKTYNINPYYKFEDEQNKFILDFDYVDYTNDNVNDLYQLGPSEISYDDQRYFQNGKYRILTYKGDYKRTLGEGSNWMFGTKYSRVSTDSDLSSFFRNTDGNFILDADQSNGFLVDEDILAIYSKMVKKWENWSFSGGLRWENSYTKGTSTNLNEVRSRRISKLFPSASIDRKINDKLGANLSYSYRILRPSYNSLNAFVYYYDPYTFEQGNPNLKPEFTNSFQFNLTYDNQPFFSVGYKNTDDALFEIISQNDVTAQTSRSVINLAKRENWSFRGFAPVGFLEGLDGYAGIIVNYNKYESESLAPKLDLDKWSFTWYTNLEYSLPWDINSELTGYYTTGGLQGQIEHDWLAGLSFALGKKFMDDRLKINLGIEEILNRKFIGSINYDTIDADIISDWSRQNVYFQLAYNFGSNFNKEKAERNPSEEEQDRIKDNN
ncbi:outer membrane beta-barrel protein [Zobellia galactanivorans]|uniref:outer membrane beta-barrel protein n=1 Tax=Zobellia galactanivorans (strain DSM 12802 / CCUG 47099 / CIP 106680 / NCIMB 13871 / Dsij) TaxID=63186 RepID=UPI001C070B81|nr:outer membrane beta-barrel protein [Zobellia galactanivorans]MBU3026011.1 TonB-dependent receptor [Zobellia galactanivorans]